MLTGMTRLLVCVGAVLAGAAQFGWPADAGTRQRSGGTFDEACTRAGGHLLRPYVPVALPGWRNRYPDTTILVRRSAIRRRSPPLRVTSPTALAGIDQGVVLPSRTLTVVVYGRSTAGRAFVLVGWTGRTRVHERIRILNFVDGSDTHSFRLPRNARLVTVALIRQGRRGILEVDRVEVRSRGRQLLRNSELRPAVCSPTFRKGHRDSSAESTEEKCLHRRPASGDPRLVRVTVPAWSDRYEQMNVLAPHLSNASGPLRITSVHGLSGIDQTAQLPRMLATISVQGHVVSGAAELVVAWSEKGAVRKVEHPLRLTHGFETRDISLPAGKGLLAVTVGVVQLVHGGELMLDRVELKSGGRQRLRNSALSFDVCPPLPKRPNAAFAMPVWLRWPCTFVLLALVALALGRPRPRANAKRVVALGSVRLEGGASYPPPKAGPPSAGNPPFTQPSETGPPKLRRFRLLPFVGLVVTWLGRAGSSHSHRR